ncbi:uncharacterized protein JN550_013577 [Neoarthrinium moseri]|uniref:uncharacterized protein n=1 Tax=Neoarthrinium moseri TaxID=1658444 RepID=UPI001FDE09EC|nr:uncharacterized protein JN550_013577 [Neoarthrinium moseri]KAI1856941.1 hypothetical protein JN550_013577 [Neoarthrinium moseri]
MQAPRRQQRRRPPRSCAECRRRKIKCDRDQPCSQCVLSNGRCLYDGGAGNTTSQHQRRPRLSVPSSGSGSGAVPSSRGSRTGTAGPHPHQRQPAAVSQAPPPLTVSLTEVQRYHDQPSSRPSINPDGRREGEVHDDALGGQLTRRLQSLEEWLSKYAAEVAAATGMASNLASSRSDNCSHEHGDNNDGYHMAEAGLEGGDQLVLHKSRLFGQTHWTNAVHEFKRIAAFMRNEARSSLETATTTTANTAASVQQVRALLQQCKNLSKTLKTTRPGRFLSHPESVAYTRDAADHLARLYISHFESVFRILHVPSFWSEWENYWADPAAAMDVTTLRVQLVVAIGSELSGDEQPSSSSRDVRQTACRWVFAAQDWLAAPLEKDRLSLDCIQIQCLLMLARQVLSIGSDLSWVAMGTLLRCAIQLGLHRDPKHFPSMSLLEAEVRKRLWATILELNIQTSLDSGTPPGISHGDFDTGPPSNVNDEDLDASMTARTLKQQPDRVTTQTSLQRFLLRNLPDRLEMLHCMNGIDKTLKDEDVLSLSARIGKACRECVPYCQPMQSESEVAETERNEADIAIFRRATAQFLLRRFLLVLHRPLAGRINENALYYHSRKVSFDTAAALLKPVNSTNAKFSRLMIRGGGMFRSCLNHISLALASELLIEIGNVGEEGEKGGSSAYRQLLEDAVKEVRDLWAERLRRGDTNVRLHMKLSIVLGMVEKEEDEEERGARGRTGGGGDVGISTQQRMTKSAQESLETCIRLIKRSFSDWSITGSEGRAVDEPMYLTDYSFDLGDDTFRTSELGVGLAGGGEFSPNALLF